MEPLQGDTVTNDSCSCTSYDYNSESDCQTLIRLLAEGCRINRLFNGKYIPLRESKLLDKLIETRALYDALRSQLLSNSVSVSSKDNLKSGQDPKENTNSLEAKNSGDIFALVDLVDKGAVLGSRKLSVCCSCCNCNSKAHLPENIQKGRRNRGGAYMPSRSNVSSKHGTGEELKLGKQFKAKNIKSDPCTRAGKLEELIKLKLQSRVMLKKNRPEQPWERNQHFTDKNNFLTINNEKMRKSYHKLKRYKARPTQYIENMGEGGINKIKKIKPNQQNFEVKTMSSIEQLKLAQQKIKDSFIADLKDTQKSKFEGDSIIKNIVENNAFPTRENTAIKFKDKVSGKGQPQDKELQNRVRRILTKNGQAEKDDKNINISGRPKLGVRKEQYAIPGRTANKEQKRTPRIRNRNYTLDEKQKVNKNVSKTFNKVTYAIANSIKFQKPKELYPSIVLQDKKKSAKSMTSIKSPEIVNKMENFPLSKTQEKKQMKSKIRRHPGKFLKSISTTSIKKFPVVEKKDRNTRQTVTKRSSLNILNDKNKLKSDPSIQKRKKTVSSDAPMRFVRRERSHKKPPTRYGENRPHEDPNVSKDPLNTKRKQKKKSIKTRSHALKRCLSTLKIKVKKTKSAITKIGKTGDIPEAKVAQSIKTHDSKTSHDKSIEPHFKNKSAARDALQFKYPETDNQSSKKKQDIQHESVHKDGLELKDRQKMSTNASKCECSDTDMNVKQNKGTYKDSTIKPSLNQMTAKDHRIISLNVASECECITTKEKGSLKYKKTNTHTDKKSTSQASTETKEKGKLHNHSVQTINNVTTKEKQSRKPGHKTNTTQETKSIFNRITKCKCPVFIKENIIMSSKKQKMHDVYNSKPRFSVQISKKAFSKDKFKISLQTQSAHKGNPQLNDRKKISTHASKCECSDADKVNIKQNRGSNSELLQTTINPSSNQMIAKDENHSAHINTPHKTISLNSASKCECFDTKEKGSLNYKQTNTHTDKKSINHASTETKEKGMFQNHSVQTINNVTTKEKQSRKLYPQPKTNTTHHETKSIFNRITKCKCPIVMKENKIVSSKNQEMSDYNSRTRFTAEISKTAFSKDVSKIPLESNSKIKQPDLYKSTTKMEQVQNKQSQLSNTAGKTKYTAAKHGLRRLKLSKFEKKKNKFRKHFKGAVSSTTVNKSEYLKIQPKDKSISISTERKIYHKVELSNIKAIEARKLKKHIKVSKKRSNSSLTSRSAQLPRSKKIHSILVSHKSEIPIQVTEKNKLNLPTNTRQHVRSNFATNILRKKKPTTYSPSCQCKDSKIKRESKISTFENHDLTNNDTGLQKSSIGNENKLDTSVLLSSTIKRCLCSLKIHNKDRRKKKHIAIATDSEPVLEKMYPEIERPTRSPINIGLDTQKPKMISKSSDTRKLPNTSKLLFINSDFKQRQSPLQKLKNLKEYTELHHLPKNDKPMCLKESLRQGVEVGSNLSFSIEFYKDIIPENKFITKRINNMNVYFSNNSQDAKQLKIDDKRKSCLKATKVTVIPSVSQTCRRIKDEQRRDNLVTPFVIAKPTQVYAMSTVTVAQSNMNLPEIIFLNEVNLGSRCVDSYDLANCPEKELNKTKQLQYFNKQSISSVFSIAFKSEKMQSYTGESKCNLLQINSLNQSLLDFTSKEMLRFDSKFRYEINNQQPILRSTHSEIDLFAQEEDEHKGLEIQKPKNSPIIIKKTNPLQLTGIPLQPFLRRCYCTMNIQVTQQSPKRRRHRQYPTKLKDYECEPGVCIPYECDPNECQKMIMKRLMKKVSRMSGTENRMKTSASSTSSIRSWDDKGSGKKTKFQSSSAGKPRHRAAKIRHTGLRYQTLPRSLIPQRQAVRIGSNFSFNMEFSKGSSKSAPTPEFVKKTVRPSTTRSSYDPYRRRRDRGTGYEVGRQHRESQSRMKQLRHRASSVTPMLRRCFCTLKLQKKGRQQKEHELQTLHQGTSTPPKFYVEKPILRTTDTSQNTKIKRRFPELLPYECEPNICVPGECDPHECLELIKKRRTKYTRDLGTESMKSNLTSSSSMTSQRRTRRRHVQSRNVHMNQTRSRDTIVRSKPSVIESQVTPTRQAVRLGSSFSFDIEFFKDKSPSNVNMRSPETYEYKPPRHVRKVPKHAYTHHEVREIYSQDRKSSRDTQSQIGLIKHGQSTMTGAFLKRCFCTAKLQGIKVDTEPKANQERTSISTMKRCLCHLKALTGKKEPNKTAKAENEKVTPLPEKHVVKTQTRAHSSILQPYECEPGVCVPGRCDPYECEKMIRKRRAREKGVGGTTRQRTKSTSSSFTSSTTSRARMTQSKPVRQYERTRNRNLSRRDMVVKEKVRTPVLPHKQVVKIASNFSFNIEFYKDNMPDLHQVQAAATPVRKFRPTRDQAHEARRNKTKDRRLMGKGSSVYTRGSQMDVTKTKDQSLGPILKRCFCTLKLHKERNIKKDKQIHQGTATPYIKEVPTLQSRSMMTTNKYKALTYNLKPYECEPGVCVPGECDPFECDKRIKKRLMNRASGTLTDQYRTRSTASTIRPHRRYRDRDAQSMRHTRSIRTRDIPYKVRRPEMRSKVVERSSKQAVNIGSNFSFNMEFFKDKSPGGSVVNSKRMKQYDPYERPRRTASRSTEWRSSSRTKKAQHPRTVRDMDSQVLARKMRSKTTGVGPFLKRCFCTLQLHKSEKDEMPFNKPESVSTKTENIKRRPKTEPKHENTSTSTLTRSPAQFHKRKLEPYECEPGVCVPGECDPYECEKRIKRRMQSKQSSTDPHRGRSVSSSIGESTKSRHRRIQALSSTPSGDRFRSEGRVSSTDSSPNRQAVRIGSSFSFNVEFYKDQLPSARDVTKIIKRGIKGTETQPKGPRSTSSYSKRTPTRHCQSQSDCIRTECKSSCAPLLKRCFCTLKLQKMGKQQQDITTKIEPTMKSMGTRTPVRNKLEIKPVAREIGTKTKRYTYPLEPYECEPGVCIPGLCDPYECEKRIKLRNMKHFGTGTTRASMKSMYSLTSKDMGTKAMNTYRIKHRKPSIQTVYDVERPPPPRRVENVNRQSVHLGSNFSFNLEFFKDQGGVEHDDIQTHYKPRARKTSISTANRTKLRNRGSHGRENSLYHRQLQAGAQTQSRGSGMGPLKRCFCTLTLQRAEVKNTLSSPVAKNMKLKTQNKKTSTKKYNSPPVPLKLESYECEPYVCTPGECNPYECLERIKKRGIRRMSRTTGTRMKRTSQVSVSSKRTQFKTEGFSPQKVERIVEEPRFSFLRGNPNRQGVKISSNFSFNIEFFKEVSTPGTMEVTKNHQGKEISQLQDTCNECKKTGHSTNTRVGQHGTRNYLHDNDSQSEAVKTEDKSSAVAMLRRCFCTAKLHKSHLARSDHPQSLTVGRVEEVRPISLFGPKEYWVQYQIQPAGKNTLSENTKGFPNIKSITKNNKTIYSNKLETIMSYTPRKFNKNNDTVQEKPMDKKSKSTTSILRKMLKSCKNLFVTRINHNENNEKEDVKPTEIEHNKQPRIDVLKASKSERHPNSAATATIKISKSLKVAKISEKNIYKKKYSRYESGDAIESNKAGNKPHKSGINYVKKTCPNCHVQSKQPISSKQVHFALSNKGATLKSIIKPTKESKSVSFLYKGSMFRKSENLRRHVLCSHCGGFKREKPLLSPGLDKTNADLLKDVNILPQKTREKGKKSCPCCICRKREIRINIEKQDANVRNTVKHDINITNTAKQDTNVTKIEKQNTNVPTNLNLTLIPRKKRLCICGSVTCKEEAEKLADSQYSGFKKSKIKKIICGTSICAAESMKEALAKESEYMRARRTKREENNKEREAQMRELRFKKEDKEIMKRRKLDDKYMMKKLKKYKETSDIMLLAESLLDIGKLGITSATEILRNVGRTVIDAKRTYRNLLTWFREPMRTWKKFQDAANDGPGVATLKRIKLRCKGMTCLKKGHEQLEAHPVTIFVRHANDKDPRRRLQAKKLKKPRRDFAFACSPFMLSLRKRPWLSVYYTCSWFYPHCHSLLQVWRQFMDVMLFLLAVAVWSPCILCMELSRALKCCFLCTG